MYAIKRKTFFAWFSLKILFSNSKNMKLQETIIGVPRTGNSFLLELLNDIKYQWKTKAAMDFSTAGHTAIPQVKSLLKPKTTAKNVQKLQLL